MCALSPIRRSPCRWVCATVCSEDGLSGLKSGKDLLDAEGAARRKENQQLLEQLLREQRDKFAQVSTLTLH